MKADIHVQIDAGEADEGLCITCGTDEKGTWICCEWHHLCCVGLSASSNLVQSFGSALNVDPWLYYRSYPLKRSLNENTVIPNARPTLGKNVRE